MSTIQRSLTALAFSSAMLAANAAEFHFTGNITSHNDVIRVPFTLTANATNVSVWTDSYLNGTNFDPFAAVWNVTAGGTLVDRNDDGPNIAPGQTRLDSGLRIPALSAGNYMFTVGAYPNFNVGVTLGRGFRFDNDIPIPLSQWCQVSNQCGLGSAYSLHLSGVDRAINSVPEPETYALMFMGLAFVAAVARRRAD